MFLAASAACSSSGGGSSAPASDAPGNDGGATTSDGSAAGDGAPGASAWAPVDTQGFGTLTSMRAYGAQLYVTFERTGGTGVAVLEAGTFRELFDTAKHPTIDGTTVKADLPVSLGADGSVWTGWDDGLC
ncbi:MAG: hypothetical protein HOO96_00755, partial [Polyangiaceae bacterium]|nr:hypothetical protein [Polyangiaceae bacterium]